jgi:hypothetical protein
MQTIPKGSLCLHILYFTGCLLFAVLYASCLAKMKSQKVRVVTQGAKPLRFGSSADNYTFCTLFRSMPKGGVCSLADPGRLRVDDPASLL